MTAPPEADKEQLLLDVIEDAGRGYPIGVILDNRKLELQALVDKAVKKEKLMRLAAEIREGELKAKLEPFEKFAAHIRNGAKDD